jgi:ElaB/YqjD/DUF883 family membrane-anchored ribosome-binding protein
MRINRLEAVWPRTKAAAEPSTEGAAPSFREKAQGWERDLETLMAEHPKAAIAAATVAGIFLGWMVKRR